MLDASMLQVTGLIGISSKVSVDIALNCWVSLSYWLWCVRV
jgi:hypothetical protein